jgi:tetratricopeptide (TPR) repeat protein
MISSSLNLEKYLKKSDDPTSKRKYDRLPVNIPIIYSFYDPKKKGTPDFRQCSTVDVSSSGLAIQIINPPDETNKYLNTPKQKIVMSVDIPKSDDLIEFTGTIKWVKTEKIKKNFKVLAGVEFDEADLDKSLNILSYAISIRRKQKAIKISIIALSILLVGVTIWGSVTLSAKKEVVQKLDISEADRSNLKKEVDALINKKNELDTLLKSNADKLELQSADLAKQMEELKKSKEDLEKNIELIEDFEEKIYDFVVVSESENVFIDMSSDLSAFQNEDYIKGNKALDGKRLSEAISSFKKYVKEHPKSSLGYSGLARALYRADREKESKEAFKKYLELIKKKKKK